MGVVLTLQGPGAPQGGYQTVKCSVPANLAAFDSLAVNTNPGGQFITVTKVSEADYTITEAARINIDSIVSAIGSTAF